MIFTSKSEQETQKFGQKFAQRLKGGEIIGLSGDLGGGKTTFVKGLARGLGIRDLVTSPTFVMLKEYRVRDLSKSLLHVDLYRLQKPEEIETIGLKEYLKKPDKICVIEWAEKIRDYLKKLPAKIIWIEFEYKRKNEREIKVQNF